MPGAALPATVPTNWVVARSVIVPDPRRSTEMVPAAPTDEALPSFEVLGWAALPVAVADSAAVAGPAPRLKASAEAVSTTPARTNVDVRKMVPDSFK